MPSKSSALLFIRLAVGTVLVAHGSQKLFGLFGGGGIAGTGAYFESVGVKPGRESAIAAGLGEAGGGAALLLGLATPVAAAAAAGTMTVAASQHASKGFFNADGGFEFPMTLGLVASSFLVAGPGRFSLDHATGHIFDKPWMRVVAGLAIAPAAAYVIVRQRRAAAEIAAATSVDESDESAGEGA